MSKVSRTVLKDGVVSAGGRSLPLRIRVDSRSRLMVLRLARGGSAATVTVPSGVTRKQALDFARGNGPWLEGLLERLGPPVTVADGATVPLRGVPHRVQADGRRGSGAAAVARRDAHVIRCQRDDPGAAVESFLKGEALADASALAAGFCALVGVRASGIRVKDTRARWGSCTSDGVLSFSWRAVMAPPWVLGYLVAHEVSHLVHFDHGPGFWALCRSLSPDVDRAKQWLATEGQRLQMYQFRPPRLA